MNNNTDLLYNLLLETGVYTEGELIDLTNINGYNNETLENALFYRTAWRSYEQAEEALNAGEFYSNM